MPELPEIESIRRYLVANGIEGSRIERVEVGWSDSVAAPDRDIEGFANGVSGARIGKLGRRGKYLILPLESSGRGERYLVLHMGMTGSLHIRNQGEESVRFRRAAVFLGDGRRIELNDSRRWARLWCVNDATDAFPRLAPEPWDMRPEELADRLRSKRSRIKPTLLDQSVIAGVGNIYADESLIRSGISPLRRCNRISVARIKHLHQSIIEVLDHAIGYISTHPSEDGSPFVVDAYDDRMRIKRRTKDATCPMCRSKLTSQRIAGRTAYCCRKCQR